MGGSQCSKNEAPPCVELDACKNTSIRASMRTKLPMPDSSELERKFTKVLVSAALSSGPGPGSAVVHLDPGPDPGPQGSGRRG